MTYQPKQQANQAAPGYTIPSGSCYRGFWAANHLSGFSQSESHNIEGYGLAITWITWQVSAKQKVTK